MKNAEIDEEFAAKVKAQRKLISLRGKVLNARKRWEKSVQENIFGKYSVKGDSARSPIKKLYFARSGKWCEEVQIEISNLERAITNAGYVERGKPRTLWIPVVIKNAIRITLTIYSAKSVRNISLAQARAFAKKAGFELKQSNDQYSVHSQTGRYYALRVKRKDGIEVFPFTDWAVCLYREASRKPKFNRSDKQHDLLNQQHTKSIASEIDLDEPICRYKNSALYIRRTVLADLADNLGTQDVVSRSDDDEDEWNDEEWDTEGN